ncbi:MAG: hypothetical protein U0271_27715 [Polyangiaceae bacterium]
MTAVSSLLFACGEELVIEGGGGQGASGGGGSAVVGGGGSSDTGGLGSGGSDGGGPAAGGHGGQGGSDCVPAPRDCTSTKDNDCSGTADYVECTGCTTSDGQQAVVNDVEPCFTFAPPATPTGVCQSGTKTCDTTLDKTALEWGPCIGETGPTSTNDSCDPADNGDENCDGLSRDGCPCPPGQCTVTQLFTGAAVSFVVPAGVTALTVDAYGAEGGHGGWGNSNNTTGTPGLGGRYRAVLSVTPGETLTINVGGKGLPNVAGYNGGGAGHLYAGNYLSGGGGGATTVLRDMTMLLAAGGGGGAGEPICGASSVGGGGGGGTPAGPGACGQLPGALGGAATWLGNNAVWRGGGGGGGWRGGTEGGDGSGAGGGSSGAIGGSMNMFGAGGVQAGNGWVRLCWDGDTTCES